MQKERKEENWEEIKYTHISKQSVLDITRKQRIYSSSTKVYVVIAD